jgi:uncharacterized protein (TIGR02246 family)
LKAKEAMTTQNEEHAIRQLVDDWLDASKKGDLTTLMTLMTDDVVFLVPGKEPFGKEVFAQNFQQLKDTKLETISDIQEIKVLDDWAWMHNFLQVTFITAGEKPIRRSGHILTVLRKKADGKWAIARDANLLTPQSESES